MSIKRTYFLNRLDEEQLDRLLSSGDSFYLENVTSVDAMARRLIAAFAGLGLNARMRDDRYSLRRDMATTLTPWPVSAFVGVYLLARMLIDSVKIRFAKPRVDVLIIMRTLAVEVRYRRVAR